MRPRDIKELIRAGLENPLEHPPLYIWGQPGIGKSDIVRQVVDEQADKWRHPVGLVDFRAPQMDATDIRGVPVPDIPKGVSRWLPPEELPRVPPDPERGLLFADELTSAPPLVQASLYQLTLDREIGDYQVPDGYYIVAAGNRMEDRAVVFRMSAALANRFYHVTCEVNPDDWDKWAMLNKVEPVVIAFIKFRPDLLAPDYKAESSEKAFATPRTWVMASKLVKSLPKKLLPEALEGAVGKGSAAEFGAFLKCQTELPDLNAIFAGDNTVPKRTDLRYALIAALVSRAKESQFERLIQYSKAWPEEYAVMMVTMLSHKNLASIAAAPSWKEWALNHSDVIIAR